MDVVCRDAETLGVKWRNHYVLEADAKKCFKEILRRAKKAKYRISKNGERAILVNDTDYITVEK